MLDEKKLARGGYGGLIGVGQGSSRPPRLVQPEYAPARATRHVALVGKGSPDTGGISPARGHGGDEERHVRRCRGAQHGDRRAVRLDAAGGLLLAVAENMPSGTAQRPSDVITIRGGKTVEVLNTTPRTPRARRRPGRRQRHRSGSDRGRRHPDRGADGRARQPGRSAVMSNDDDLRERIHELAADTGEQFWPMSPARRTALEHDLIADIANIGDWFGGMFVAGLFLAEFVGVRGGAYPVRCAPPWRCAAGPVRWRRPADHAGDVQLHLHGPARFQREERSGRIHRIMDNQANCCN